MLCSPFRAAVGHFFQIKILPYQRRAMPPTALIQKAVPAPEPELRRKIKKHRTAKAESGIYGIRFLFFVYLTKPPPAIVYTYAGGGKKINSIAKKGVQRVYFTSSMVVTSAASVACPASACCASFFLMVLLTTLVTLSNISGTRFTTRSAALS